MHLKILGFIALTFISSCFGSAHLFLPEIPDGCETKRDEWKCCASVLSNELTVCIDLRVLRENLGVDLKVTFNNLTVIDDEISLRNPPPICADIPYMEKIAAVCLRMYDVFITKQQVSGCFRVEARVVHHPLIKVKIACFNIPYSKYGHWVDQDNLNNNKISTTIRKLNSSNTMKVSILE